MEAIERELEEVKAGMQRLPSLEKSVENLNQNVARILHSLEETQRTVVTLVNPKVGLGKNLEGEGSGSIVDESAPIHSIQQENRQCEEMGKEQPKEENNWRGHQEAGDVHLPRRKP